MEKILFTDKTKDQVYNWITCNKVAEFEDDIPVLKIQTPEGIKIARFGDYIVKDLEGNYWPCKPSE